MAFLDDVYVTTPPERTATVEQSVVTRGTEVNQRKTQLWNKCGERPQDCDHLVFRTNDTVWFVARFFFKRE